MRKLASIQRIVSLTAIPGADKIETARVLGWDVVVKKGEYQVGELVVYCEIDSWIPNTIAPFLTKEGYPPKEYDGIKGERLKTIKLRKQISQGLILPLNAIPSPRAIRPEEGDDVTEALGIVKWEAPEERNSNNGNGPQASKTRQFPYFIRKTDQERIQNYAHIIEKELDTVFEVTVKKDGSSCTVFKVLPTSEYFFDIRAKLEGKLSLWQKFKRWAGWEDVQPIYGICSRNVLLPLEGNSNFHKAAQGALDVLDMCWESVAIQGEVVAPDIQGNYEKVQGIEYHVFDIFDIEKQEYMTPAQRHAWVWPFRDVLEHVSILDCDTLRNIINYKEGDDIVQKILDYAEGPGDNLGVQREGVVFKALDKDFSFKAISNSYLLHKG